MKGDIVYCPHCKATTELLTDSAVAWCNRTVACRKGRKPMTKKESK